TAHCYIHAAALVAEYLKRQGKYEQGCAAFYRISPNVVPDESMMKSDEGMAMEQRFTLVAYDEMQNKVAYDEMQNKVKELEQVTTQSPPDMKRLQLVLQGSVSVQ
ncbi:predicted protein, partial [Nematostella vectensis]